MRLELQENPKNYEGKNPFHTHFIRTECLDRTENRNIVYEFEKQIL